jgi:hypothetical protein
MCRQEHTFDERPNKQSNFENSKILISPPLHWPVAMEPTKSLLLDSPQYGGEACINHSNSQCDECTERYMLKLPNGGIALKGLIVRNCVEQKSSKG